MLVLALILGGLALELFIAATVQVEWAAAANPSLTETWLRIEFLSRMGPVAAFGIAGAIVYALSRAARP